MEPTLGWMTLGGIALISLGAAVLTAAIVLMVRDSRGGQTRTRGSAVADAVRGQELDLLVDDTAREPEPWVAPDPALDAIEARIDEVARRVARLTERRGSGDLQLKRSAEA